MVMKKLSCLFSFTLFLLACALIPAQPIPTVPAIIDVTAVPATAKPTLVPTLEQIPPTASPIPEVELGKLARAHLEALTAIGPRLPGSKKEQEAAKYIVETFEKLGYSPQTQSFSATDEDDYEFTSSNVIAVKQGDSPKEIIIGAHYDSGDESLGADDNASGVAIMLEVAEQLADLKTPYTIRFIAFGSEENDLDGSYFYAQSMKQTDVDNTITMINLDSLAAGDITYVYSDEGKNAFLRDWVLEWAGKNNIPLQTIPNVDITDGGEYVADYGAYKDRGIPFTYFEATNWMVGTMDGWTQVDPIYGDEGYIWHTQYDNLAYLDKTFPGRVDEHLKIFVSALDAICTEFTLP
jgi:alkaline phosphatase isozyme conversion protein